jgi:hypothetical protein
MGYNTREDICNRALQHLGVNSVDRISSLTDGTKAARECALAYDKVREAELRRKAAWRFSIREAALRPVDTTTTKLYVPPVYASGTTYTVGDIVTYTDAADSTSRWWLSTKTSNTGNTPTSGDPWENYFGPDVATSYDSTIGYFSGELVYDGSNNVWISLVNDNTATLAESASWHELTGTLKALLLIYPIGTGPSSQSTTRNIFRLPYGFLREAPQDPRAGSFSALGAPSNRTYDDWEYESDYIVSGASDPIVLRFAADWTDVTTMDPLFCEGLAARLAFEICESITQSQGKHQTVIAEYQKAMGEARLVDAIEVGSVEPPLDDYLACRI